MAERPPLVTQPADNRVAELLRVVELMAAGDTNQRLAISDKHDELDAIAHGINVLVGELGWATARIIEAQEERAAAAERASAAKNMFFRNLSHEIRTPIAAMLGFADLLSSADPAEPLRVDLIKRLQANGLAVLSLLDDVLDLARLDANKVVLRPEAVCVVDLVREVLASLQVDSRAKGLLMRVEAADEALGSIRTDRYRLRQILVNLATNAVKFTQTGSITASLGADAGQQWTIDLTDTGIGITQDQRAHLFEPFEQANASSAQAYGGSGLGLALSRKLAEQLGGTLILLHSAAGEGSTFRLTLTPLKDAEPIEPAAAPADEKTVSGIEGLRVLLAEDHRDLHAALRAQLERAGAKVESVHDGREAVERVQSGVFDVVLMDLRMPNMDGLQATRALRNQGYDLPIIALTADPATLRRAEALTAGCDACLSKPFKADDLISAIRLSAHPRAL
jgi:signal transduction histidine kinase